MTVWIDAATWPAHGTVFAHLVSDSSLAELHELAETAGCDPRAFDRDHYDVPQRLHASCVAAGAIEAHTRQLVRALRSSGLRRTKAMVRAETLARKENLLSRWPLSNTAVAEELISRWSEQHRAYHDLQHLQECLNFLQVLGNSDRSVELAAWFHDAVYAGEAGTDEQRSAELAESLLRKEISESEVAEVSRLVRLTAGHRPEPDDLAGQLLCDADLAILGSDPVRYDSYRRAVRREYAAVPREDCCRGRAAVLDQLRSSKSLYHTEIGRRLWQEQALTNLNTELVELTASR